VNEVPEKRKKGRIFTRSKRKQRKLAGSRGGRYEGNKKVCVEDVRVRGRERISTRKKTDTFEQGNGRAAVVD